MRLLILGGTVFVGRHLVAAALARGHEVSIFNRGRESGEVDPRVERLVGDRRRDLSALEGRSWDAVIDVAAYVPSVVERALATLKDRVEHCTFVSTRSVYADGARSKEDDPVATMTEDELARAEAIEPQGRSIATLYGASYGALKARCEAAAERAMAGRVLIARPGLIVGPFDPTDRFTYWPHRVSRGGDVLAPGAPDRIIRFLDARDLAAWIIRSIEARLTGTFNVAGEDEMTMRRLLEVCREVSSSDARFVWASDAFLLERGVEPWSELPLWVPAEMNGFLETGNDKAIARGLVFRSVVETVKDTLGWDRVRKAPRLEAGLDPAREAELLAALPSLG